MTALVRKLDADFGKALVGAARDQQKKDLQDRVVGVVKALLLGVERAEQIIANAQESLDTINKQLSAIEAGEFSLEGTQIKYANPDLQKNVVVALDYSEAGNYIGVRTRGL